MRALIGFVFSLGLTFQCLAMISIDKSNMSKSLGNSAQDFVDRAAKLLPPPMLAEVPNVQIQFLDFSAVELSAENICDATSASSLVLGKTNTAVFGGQVNIILNKKFLSLLDNVAKWNQAIPCSHGTWGKVFVATFLHEFMHVYDLYSRSSTGTVTSIPAHCKSASTETECKDFFSYPQRRISDSPEFLHTFFFENSFDTSKSVSRGGSPDSYEFKNSKEGLSVNFEYFILDPSYKCRFKNRYAYLQKALGWNPSNQKCAEQISWVLESSNALLSFDKSKITKVSYFFATPGEGMASKWGHAMFLLESDQDPLMKIVVGYRGLVSGIAASSWDGLSGKYPLHLFADDLASVRREYNVGELRDLQAYKLKLSSAQLSALLNQLDEVYWSYEGRYRFLTRNCATETQQTLQSIFGTSPFSALRISSVITPLSLLNLLQSYGVIASTAEVTFPSRAVSLQKAAGLLRQVLGQDMLGLSSGQRQQLFESSISSSQLTSDMKKNILHGFLIIESHVLEKERQNMQGAIFNYYMKNAPAEGEQRVGRELQKYIAALGRLKRTSYLNNAGYGVPLPAELIANSESRAEAMKLGKEMGLLDQEVKKSLYRDFQKLEDSLQFMKRISEYISFAGISTKDLVR